MEERVYTTASGRVHYWVDAPDAALPWMVFVPGLTADHTLFEPQLAYFAGKANLLVWDAPAHAASRPYPLDFTLDDYARILHGILVAEGVATEGATEGVTERTAAGGAVEHTATGSLAEGSAACAPIGKPLYVGQSLGGYVGQAYLDLFPGSFRGFVSIDSAPLQRDYYQAWELAALERTYRLYLSIPWKLLVEWGSAGCAETSAGRKNMRQMMQQYGKAEYCRLAAHGYAMLAKAVRAARPYRIDCPVLLLCGEKDAAGSTKRYNRAWHERAGLPLEWVPGAGHNSNVDAPEFVNACIEEFLAAVG